MSPAWTLVLIVLGVIFAGLIGGILVCLTRRRPPDRRPTPRLPIDDWGNKTPL